MHPPTHGRQGTRSNFTSWLSTLMADTWPQTQWNIGKAKILSGMKFRAEVSAVNPGRSDYAAVQREGRGADLGQCWAYCTIEHFFVCNRENSQLKKLRDHGVATLSETGHHFVQMYVPICPLTHIFLGMNIHLVFTRGPSWFWFTRKRIGCGRAIADCPGAQFVQLIQSGANLIWDGPTIQPQYSQRSQIRSLDDPNMTIRHGRSRWVQDFKVTGRVRSQEERHQLIIWNLMIPIFNIYIYYNDNEL